ncbi:hypothetical protein EWF20_03305 [Sulfolobus sp. S-194]|uniref:DNA import protein CedA n=1 Tax=Sulfolobus sp. S-194 TaxID=2512240 RepID=UPI00143712D4|nr:DNA import protein CedA [Sulfolobus sp. S-194]QIW23263.1 hypothetical protein EWF20_03305 [Sulfolobus sp. S-194]
MWNIFDFLFYAQILASLTYSLGALFYALPIPVYGVKKWGPRMITDSIYIVVWITIYTVVLSLMQQLLTLLGASWSSYFQWLYAVENYDIIQYEIIEAIINAMQYVSGTFAPFMLFTFLLSMATSFIEFLTIISQMIYQYSGLFIAMGILLMAIPFRIGRAIGASFIASSIVFYIGLPYLPIFLTQLDLNILNIHLSSSPNISIVLQYEIPEIFIANLLAPTSYIILLSGLSIGLGNTIGGYGSRVPFLIDIV